MDSSASEILLHLHDWDATFRITLSPQYGRNVADLSMSRWQDAIFEVEAYPFSAKAETTFTGEEVDLLHDLIARFQAGENVEFDEEQQIRFALAYDGHDYEGSVLVTATLHGEGGEYPELRFLVRKERPSVE